MEAMKQRMEDLETFWHGWKHERQVVQYLLEVPLGLVFPLGFL
jgi:hypothetical protein